MTHKSKNKRSLRKKSNRFYRTIRGRSHKIVDFTCVSLDNIRRCEKGYNTLRSNALIFSRPPKYPLNAYHNCFKTINFAFGHCSITLREKFMIYNGLYSFY